MLFRQIFLRDNQIDDLLDLLQKQEELSETLEDVKCQLIDARGDS